MTLSLVADPVDILPRDAFEADHGCLLAPALCVWVERLGLLALGDTDTFYEGHIFLIQMDGTACRVGYTDIVDELGVDANGQAMFGRGVYWSPVHIPSCAPLAEAQGGSTIPLQFAALSNRLLTFDCGTTPPRILAYPLGGGSGTVEFTFEDADGAGGIGIMMRASQGPNFDHWYCFNRADGNVFLYDAIHNLEVPNSRTSFGGEIRLAGYSVKHNLFFVVRRNTSPDPDIDQLYVYANEPQADFVDGPFFLDPPLRGSLTQLYVQVVGDMGEPCIGRNVTFEVTQGTVDPATVATDSEGFARTTYQGPFVAPIGGIVTATLTE